MFKKATPIIIKAVSPIHAGSGRELGIVDMPIQRESHSGIPKIEGSSVKGCLKEWTRLKKTSHNVDLLFGADGQEQAGLVGFSDGKLLFYPIKTLHNIFAYVTCPYLIDRFRLDLGYISEFDNTTLIDVLTQLSAKRVSQDHAAVFYSKDYPANEDVTGKRTDKQKPSIVLDEYSLEVISCNKNAVFDVLGLDPQRLVVVLDDTDFMEMISLCKEIITRNKIDHETGTVAIGQLFTEEYLPAESILYTLLLENGIQSSDSVVDNYVNEFIAEQILQIGGNSNIGKGIVKMRRLGGEISEQPEK